MRSVTTSPGFVGGASWILRAAAAAAADRPAFLESLDVFEATRAALTAAVLVVGNESDWVPRLCFLNMMTSLCGSTEGCCWQKIQLWLGFELGLGLRLYPNSGVGPKARRADGRLYDAINHERISLGSLLSRVRGWRRGRAGGRCADAVTTSYGV
jgi:hypothetical protein